MNDLFSLAGKKYLDYRFSTGHWLLLATGPGKYGAQIIINDITAERAELAVENSTEGIQAVAAPLMLLINMKLMPPLNISKRTSAPLMCW